MNEKMKALLIKMREKHAEAKKVLADGDKDKAAALMIEFSDTKKEFELEETIHEAEKALVPDMADLEAKAKAGIEGKTENGFTIIGKKLRGQALSEKEKALITGGTDGEDNLIPPDVDAAIRELRKEYKSAKDLVTAIPTTSMTGSFNFEDGTPTGLVAFDDGDEIDSAEQPAFVKKSFTIKLMGKLIPVSNILTQVEQGGLMAYLNKWFVKNAIISENAKIFSILQTGTPVAIKGLAQLKKKINSGLDPSALIGGKIITNQTGFAIMDEEEDANGRPMLQPDPTNPTRMLFKGLPIEVFSDAQLPNVSGKAPMFVGAIDAAEYFIDLLGYQFAVSEHYMFGKNQNTLRVIEGFDSLLADTGAYFYATFEEKAAAAGG